MIETLSFPDPTQLAVPFFIAAILIEFLWIAMKKRGGRYETRDAVTSLIMGAALYAVLIPLGWVFDLPSWRYLGLLALILFAAVVYFGVGHLIGAFRLSEFRRALRRS